MALIIHNFANRYFLEGVSAPARAEMVRINKARKQWVRQNNKLTDYWNQANVAVKNGEYRPSIAMHRGQSPVDAGGLEKITKTSTHDMEHTFPIIADARSRGIGISALNESQVVGLAQEPRQWKDITDSKNLNSILNGGVASEVYPYTPNVRNNQTINTIKVNSQGRPRPQSAIDATERWQQNIMDTIANDPVKSEAVNGLYRTQLEAWNRQRKLNRGIDRVFDTEFSHKYSYMGNTLL